MDGSVSGRGDGGTTIAAWFAEHGHEVTAIDIDLDVVVTLNGSRAPIAEPGFEDLLATHAGDRLMATTSYDAVPDSDITFLAVGTPSNADGSIDLGVLKAAAEATGEALAETDDRHLVVAKSTVTLPSLERMIGPAIERGAGSAVGMHTEFLREGTAVDDCLQPAKVVIGANADWATDRLNAVFDPLLEAHPAPLVNTDPQTAAMMKYANNAVLAATLSLGTDRGTIRKAVGLDADAVMAAIGLDDRILDQFLRSGVGWGGSWFPTDVAAIRAAARDAGSEPAVREAAVDGTDRQPERLVDLLATHVDLEESRIAVLGLAFTPGTDEIRTSRAIPVIELLRERGADVVAYDPVAVEPMRERFPAIDYTATAADALDGSDGAVVVTEWDEFAALDAACETMATSVGVDGRRIGDRREGVPPRACPGDRAVRVGSTDGTRPRVRKSENDSQEVIFISLSVDQPIRRCANVPL